MNMAGSLPRATAILRGKYVLVIVIGGGAPRKFKAADYPVRSCGTTSRHGVKLLIAKVSGNDRDGYREVAGILADARAERPRSVFPRSGGEHQDRDVLIVLDR